MYKAIALDLDGTTLHSDSRMSDRLVQLFHRMRAHGIKIFFVSGRTKLEMEDVIPDGLEVDGLVTANGMVSYVDDRMVSKVTLDPDLVKMSVTKAKKEGIYYEIHPLERRRYALIEDRDAMEKELSREKPDTLPDFELLNRKESLKSGLNWKKELTVEDIIKVYFFSMDTNMIRVFRTKLENLKNNYRSEEHTSELQSPLITTALIFPPLPYIARKLLHRTYPKQLVSENCWIIIKSRRKSCWRWGMRKMTCRWSGLPAMQRQ